jgi:hypothetical protein
MVPGGIRTGDRRSVAESAGFENGEAPKPQAAATAAQRVPHGRVKDGPGFLAIRAQPVRAPMSKRFPPKYSARPPQTPAIFLSLSDRVSRRPEGNGAGSAASGLTSQAAR